MLGTSVGVPVEYFPELPENYRMKHASGEILVSCIGRDFTAPKSSNAAVAEYRMRFQFTVVSRSLQADKHGAYDLLEAVYTSLKGQTVYGRPLWPLREFFIGRDNDLWKFGAIYTLTNIRL